MLRRAVSTTALSILGVVALSAAAQTLTRTDADSLQKKLDGLLQRGACICRAAQPLRTVVTEREFDAYFKFQGAQHLPAGVINPVIEILETGRLVGVVTVDLDAVRKSKSRAWNDPLNYMTGSLDVRMVGVLHAVNGKGKLDLESATLGDLPLPLTLLQELVSYYTRTPESPAGFSLDQPFDLPQKIRQVDFQRGSAVIVQ